MPEGLFGDVPVRPPHSGKTRGLANYSARQRRRNIAGGGNKPAPGSSMHWPVGGGRQPAW